MHDIEMHEVLDEFARCRVERPTANEENRLSTKRLENRCTINVRVGFR
jgi:hypothetical protein